MSFIQGRHLISVTCKTVLEYSSSEEEVGELVLSKKIFHDTVKVINGILIFSFFPSF